MAKKVESWCTTPQQEQSLTQEAAQVGGLFHFTPGPQCQLLALCGQSLHRNSLSAIGQERTLTWLTSLD
jgi:hypothetical protein